MKFKIVNINNILFFTTLYLSLIAGFLYGESLNIGAYNDWHGANLRPIKDFSSDFTYTFLNYNDYAHRHSPVYLIFLSLFLNLGFDIDQVRLIHLHLNLLLIIFFYMCLNLRFGSIKAKYFVALSFIIFLSPTFRSLSIWPDSRLPGLTFFVLTIYFFLIFKNKDDPKYAWYTCISLIVSSYISPNFSIFFPYFFFFFFFKLRVLNLSLLIIFNLLSSLPILYYLFILDVNFLTSGGTPGFPALDDIQNENYSSYTFNFSNKIMSISSIIFFHLLPVLVMKNFYKPFFDFLLSKSIILFLFTIFLVYFFNYQISYTGGGIILILSNLLFDNNYLFYISSFFFLGFVIYIALLSLNNFSLLILLIISNVQATIYHKYYEPMILIIFFTLFNCVNAKDFLKNKSNLFYLYCFSFFYILMKVFKNTYLV